MLSGAPFRFRSSPPSVLSGFANFGSGGTSVQKAAFGLKNAWMLGRCLFVTSKSGYGSEPEKPVNDRPADLEPYSRQPTGAPVADSLLAPALRRAWWTILWERLWPALASLAVAIGIFLSVSWAGLWLVLPPMGRAVALFILTVLIAIAAVPLFRF